MTKPHPSVTLILDLDESLDSKDMRLEIRRCYSYIAPTVVRTHPSEEDGGVHNTMRIVLKLGARKYLHSSDEGADELWAESFENHLVNDFYKLGNNMQIFNRRQREEGKTELKFDWLEVELQSGELVVRFHLDSESSLPSERAEMVTQVRTLYNQGVLGEGVTTVSIPSPASYQEQQAAYDAEAEERARLAAEEAARKEQEEQEAREAAEKEAEENFLESPEIDEKEDEETAYQKEEERVRREVKERYTLKDPDFVLDCKIWEVGYSDGSSRIYDSDAQAFRELTA